MDSIVPPGLQSFVYCPLPSSELLGYYQSSLRDGNTKSTNRRLAGVRFSIPRNSCRPARWLAVAFSSLVAVSVMLVAAPLRAASYSWAVSAGTWSVASNWVGSLLPTNSDTAYVVNGGTAGINQLGEICGTLSLGSSVGSGTVQMTGGNLYATAYENVGNGGTGTFIQSGGTNSCNYGISIGAGYGGTRTYLLSGGSLCGRMDIGLYGNGSFQQTGGTTNFLSTLNVACYSSGTCSLSGGVCTTNGIDLGSNYGTTGTFLLSGTTQLTSTSDEIVGDLGTGIITQSGGTNAISGNLYLARCENGGMQGPSMGTYTLSGNGQLSAAAEFIGYNPVSTALFQQTGGTNTMNCLSIASSGRYQFSGGSLQITGGGFSNQGVFDGGGTSAALAGGGNITFGGGTLQYTNSNSRDYSGKITGSTGPISIDTNGVNVTFASNLVSSNSGGLTKIGSGKLTLAAANTFSGNTLIGGGTLALGNALALQNSTLDTSGSGVLGFGSLTSATLGGLTGPGALALANSSSSAVALSVGNDNSSTTCSGMLQGVGSLNKIGNGVLALIGTNTYTGPTTINQGMLTVNGSLASPVTVDSGGTLGGTGNLTTVMVYADGLLAPGDALGTLSLSGSLILEAGAMMDYELDTPATSDEISCGNLALYGQQFTDFTFTPTANFGPGTYDLINFASSSGSLGANTGGMIDGYAATLAVQGNDLVLTVVPEPSTLVLLAAAAVGLVGYGWRRRVTTKFAKPDRVA